MSNMLTLKGSGHFEGLLSKIDEFTLHTAPQELKDQVRDEILEVLDKHTPESSSFVKLIADLHRRIFADGKIVLQKGVFKSIRDYFTEVVEPTGVKLVDEAVALKPLPPVAKNASKGSGTVTRKKTTPAAPVLYGRGFGWRKFRSASAPKERDPRHFSEMEKGAEYLGLLNFFAEGFKTEEEQTTYVESNLNGNQKTMNSFLNYLERGWYAPYGWGILAKDGGKGLVELTDEEIEAYLNLYKED